MHAPTYGFPLISYFYSQYRFIYSSLGEAGALTSCCINFPRLAFRVESCLVGWLVAVVLLLVYFHAILCEGDLVQVKRAQQQVRAGVVSSKYWKQLFLYGTALVNPSLLQIYCYGLLVGRTCKRVDEGLVYNAWDGYVSLETSETRLPKISLYILSQLGGPGRPPSVKRKKTLDQHKTKRKPRFKKTLTKQMKYRSIIKKHYYKKKRS